MTSVDHAAQYVRDGKKPRTEAEKQYAKRLKGGAVSSDYEVAFDTWDSFNKRVKVESLMMGGCPDDVFVDMLNFPEVSIKAYRELFFDLSVLRTDIDKLDFAETYYDRNCGHDVAAVDNMVLRGLNQGYQLLLLQFCNLVPSKSESLNILKRVFAAAVYKATSVQFTGMGSTIDKRAIEHSQLALKILDTMDSLREDAGASAANAVKFVSVLKEAGSVPKGFDPSNIIQG